MPKITRNFLDNALQRRAFLLGSYRLASGATSWYKFNAAAFNSGRWLSQLGDLYVQRLLECGVRPFTAVCGPAYKGISLSQCVADAWFRHTGQDVAVTYSLKEPNPRAPEPDREIQGGGLLAEQRVLLVDDALTTGGSLLYLAEQVQRHHGLVIGATIAFDRQEHKWRAPFTLFWLANRRQLKKRLKETAEDPALLAAL